MARPLGELKGDTPEANALATWLRKVTAGVTVSTLQEKFHVSRSSWTALRNGSRLIDPDLLNAVVTLIPDTQSQLRERVCQEGHRLLQAACEAEKERKSPLPEPRRPLARSRPSPEQEFYGRLDDARLKQLEAERKLSTSQMQCARLEATVGFLRGQCAQLTVERDRARAQAREELQAELERALKDSAEYRQQAIDQWEHARRAHQEAQELRLAAHEQVSRELARIRQSAEEESGAQSPAPLPAPAEVVLPPMERIGDALETSQEDLAEQDEGLHDLRMRLQEPTQPSPRQQETQNPGGTAPTASGGAGLRPAPASPPAAGTPGPSANNALNRQHASVEEPTPLTIALGRVRDAKALGAQIEALRARVNEGPGADWSHARLATEVSQGFATRKARRVVRKWLVGTVLPSWSRLQPLLTAMGASDGERAAFQEALKRVSGSATVMDDPVQILRRRRQRGELTTRAVATTSVCLVLLGITLTAGLVLSATYTAEPVQPLWKPLTIALAGACLAVGTSFLALQLHDSWTIAVLIMLGWITALLTGYTLPLITGHDYGGQALATAIGFL
ncbi:hypothetical protein ACF064_35590 [Streptomyces sp. NPDC015492]|uniref:hypothetical protein n=1 Tax=Streptomyces sp. NPDC015492 TaxID=3364958 RepID=UPI0036FCC553